MQFDTTGFQEECALQADTQLAIAQSFALRPVGEIGARANSSFLYSQKQSKTARGTANEWMVDYLANTHHLTQDTIEKVCHYLIHNQGWTDYRFLDAMMPDSGERQVVDDAVKQFRTALDFERPDNAQLCWDLAEHAEQKCGSLLPTHLASDVFELILNAMSVDKKMTSFAAIDALVQSYIPASEFSSSAAADESVMEMVTWITAWRLLQVFCIGASHPGSPFLITETSIGQAYLGATFVGIKQSFRVPLMLVASLDGSSLTSRLMTGRIITCRSSGLLDV
jgi:hypothetical protein